MNEQQPAVPSPEDSPHAFLRRMSGHWEGESRTWFKPDQLADHSLIRGTVRPVVDGLFVVHEYEGSLKGEPLVGMAVLGYEEARDRYTMAWMDNLHNGTRIMFSEGTDAADPSRFSVLGSYPAGGESWGWRTEIEMPNEKRLVITHFNITPAGQEAKGVEVRYIRRG